MSSPPKNEVTHLHKKRPIQKPKNESSCDELILHGERIPMPRFHDCAYVAARNALIEQAEQLANDLITCCPPKEDGGLSYSAWTRTFSGDGRTGANLWSNLTRGSTGAVSKHLSDFGHMLRNHRFTEAGRQPRWWLSGSSMPATQTSRALVRAAGNRLPL